MPIVLTGQETVAPSESFPLPTQSPLYKLVTAFHSTPSPCTYPSAPNTPLLTVSAQPWKVNSICCPDFLPISLNH